MPKNNRSNNIALIILVVFWAGMLVVPVASAAEHTDYADTSASARAKDRKRSVNTTTLS